jgi:hypothetical protein
VVPTTASSTTTKFRASSNWLSRSGAGLWRSCSPGLGALTHGDVDGLAGRCQHQHRAPRRRCARARGRIEVVLPAPAGADSACTSRVSDQCSPRRASDPPRGARCPRHDPQHRAVIARINKIEHRHSSRRGCGRG